MMKLRLRRQPPKVLADVFVALIWSITPVSWAYVVLYVLANFAHGSSVLVRVGALWGVPPLQALGVLKQRSLLFYALCEVVFSLYYRMLASRVQARVVGRSPSRDYVVRTIKSALAHGLDSDAPLVLEDHEDEMRLPNVKGELAFDDPRAVQFRHDMAGWILGVPQSKISREDIEDWLSWSLFGKHYAELEEEDRQMHAEHADHATATQRQLDLVEDAVALFEKRGGRTFPEHVELTPAEAARKQVMTLTLDPVQVRTRPLAMYLLTFCVNRVTMAYLRVRYGLRRARIEDITYLVMEPRGWTPEAAQRGAVPRPVLFLHGLGLGITEYFAMMDALLRPASGVPRPVLIPLLPWVSYEFFSPRFLRPWHAPESAHVMRRMLERHGFDRCGVSILSHSMGTALHTWLMRAWPELIVRSAFVDPICFQLWAPHVCYRFLYKPTDSFVEHILRYFVARELGTANMLYRHFEWSRNVLFAHEIPRGNDRTRVRVYLAGSDTVVDAPSVRRCLEQAGMQDVVEFEPSFHHGEFIMAPENCAAAIVAALDAPL